jgi:uncharacterized protein YukE
LLTKSSLAFIITGNANGGKMSPLNYKIIHKKIHPPEADALADAYGKAARSVLQYGKAIEQIMSELNVSWEGEQRDRFMDSNKNIPAKADEYAVSTLQGIEKGLRTILVDVEERVPVDTPYP